MSIDSLSTLSLDQLRQAVHLKEQIASLERQLSSILGGTEGRGASPSPAIAATARLPGRPRGSGAPRHMSPEGRARLIAAQKTRWDKFHAERGTMARTKAPNRTGTGMSPEGRARIAAAQKARWARVHAGQKGLPASSRPGPKKTRNVSPEARARMRAAVVARWARYRKQKGK